MTAWHNEPTYAYINGGAIQPGDVLVWRQRPHDCAQLNAAPPLSVCTTEEEQCVVAGEPAFPYFSFRLSRAPDVPEDSQAAADICGGESVYSLCLVQSGNHSAGAIALKNVRIRIVFAPPPPQPPPPPPPSPPPPQPPPPPPCAWREGKEELCGAKCDQPVWCSTYHYDPVKCNNAYVQ